MNHKPIQELKELACQIYANEQSGYTQEYYQIMYELSKRGWMHYLEQDGSLAFRERYKKDEKHG